MAFEHCRGPLFHHPRHMCIGQMIAQSTQHRQTMNRIADRTEPNDENLHWTGGHHAQSPDIDGDELAIGDTKRPAYILGEGQNCNGRLVKRGVLASSRMFAGRKSDSLQGDSPRRESNASEDLLA